MQDARGVGLAATQVGVLQRLFVFHANEDEEATTVVNPAITRRSRASPRSPTRAACRSRACWCRSSGRCEVTLEGRDLEGAPLRLELEQIDARVVQHELDHLDGVLMLERTDDESRRGRARDPAQVDLAAP